jgi:Sec-independent protein translocase protein TatA
MFGLGIGEILLLAAVVALVGGPAAVMKLGRAARSAHRMKSRLTKKALLDELLDDEPRDPPGRR